MQVFRAPTTAAITAGPIRGTLLLLALPVLAEQFLNTGVGLFDTYLAGRISAAATSAIGLAAYVEWLASMLAFLVGTGTAALVARHVGAKDLPKANRFANQSITLAALLGLVQFGLLFGLAGVFAQFSNMKGEAYAITVEYLRTDAIGYGLSCIMIVGCAALRGAGNMRTPLGIYVIVNVVNITASYVFVYGAGPLPAFGVTGIVMGTVVSRSVGAVITIAVLIRGSGGLRLTRAALAIRRAPTRRILRIGIPAALDGAVMWSGHLALLAVVGRLGTEGYQQAYFATHIIAIRIEALTYLPAAAWAAAVATMIGQSLGAKKPERARRAGLEGVMQCGALSVVIGTVFFFAAEPIFRVMSDDALVRALGPQPFRILAVLQPCLAVSGVLIGGLRGAGDTRFPLMISVIGGFFIRLPLGFLLGIVLQGGLVGAWIGMGADMIWRASASLIRFLGGKWAATRV